MSINMLKFCNCGTCLFYIGGNNTCHRNAPQKDFDFPKTQFSELCGEYINRATGRSYLEIVRDSFARSFEEKMIDDPSLRHRRYQCECGSTFWARAVLPNLLQGPFNVRCPDCGRFQPGQSHPENMVNHENEKISTEGGAS